MATSFPLIEVSGTSYQMGYQHGEQAASRIQGYLAWIQKLTGLPRDKLCANAIRFLPAIKGLSTALFDEICGLAHGARISMEEALLCQSRAEAASESSPAPFSNRP